MKLHLRVDKVPGEVEQVENGKDQICAVPAAQRNQDATAPQRIQELTGSRREPDLLPLRVLDSLPIDTREGRLEREDVFMLPQDRKSTRLNSSHRTISYAVF